MTKLWQPYRFAFSVVALVLLLAASAPVAVSHNANPKAQQECTAEVTTARGSKDAPKPQQKNSLFNSGSLEDPVSLLKGLFSSDKAEEDDSEIAPQASTVVLAIKALVATLASTII